MSNDECLINNDQRQDPSDRITRNRSTAHGLLSPPRAIPHSAFPIQRLTIRRLWYEFLRFPLQILATVTCRVRYWGMKNIPREGGVLVVSNHQSHLDPPLVGLACPRPMNYLARETLFRFAPFRWLILSINAIPIDREGLGLGGIKEALKRLKRGEMVLIFPEGTRTLDGKIGRFRPGFTTLAVRSQATILPVAIEGAYQCWPRSQKLPWPGIIHLRYGRPLKPEDYASLNEGDLLQLIEFRVHECSAQLRRHPDFASRKRNKNGSPI
jgi:1-acyl-sn-glycerol-3-phosphate acyltransferase